jgi:hypothetical protein
MEEGGVHQLQILGFYNQIINNHNSKIISTMPHSNKCSIRCIKVKDKDKALRAILYRFLFHPDPELLIVRAY